MPAGDFALPFAVLVGAFFFLLTILMPVGRHPVLPATLVRQILPADELVPFGGRVPDSTRALGACTFLSLCSEQQPAHHKDHHKTHRQPLTTPDYRLLVV